MGDGNGIPTPVYAALAALMMAVTAVLQEWIRARREKQAAAKVAAEVKEVKHSLEAKSITTDATLDKIHKLVNSSMSAQLKISSAALRRIADLTNDADDIAASDLADKLLREHEIEQAKMDAKESKQAQ